MARSFPQNFDLRLFFGPRAKQFARSEDAFQQLLGDALKGMAGPYAHVSPTRGRDGSIDAFLLDSAPLEGPFENLPLPLIVECKTHDETVRDLERNILAQWATVRKKLESNASAGWKDLFEPWLEARSYVYCVSAHIQAEQIRSSLTKSIEDFFAALPLDQRPPIEAVRVVDWSDLRFWLNSLPQVCDEWLGIELDLILDHATYLNRLSGFREYLLPAKLEFVQPAPDSIFHPERVLQGLEIDKDHGVLLVGGGGVGKTRTSIEVGTHAANAGWRVLHVLPDEPGIETEDLAETVLPYANSRTLLIFDYIDQMQRLDLGGLRRSLLPAANERGIQLGLLANARPGWMSLDNPERDELFRVVEIRPTEAHKSAVIETMANRVAPLASGMIGKEEVIRLCGTRAIIALLIARELELRATDNLLKDINTATFRSGDLVQWLQRRLQENALSVKHDVVSLLPARPDAPMVAAAAALACAPETRETLVQAARSALESLQWPTAQDDARVLVESLLKFGWLEAHGLFDSTAHDVVADEVLEQTIHSDAIVFERELAAVLSCALAVPRGIGRLAIALRRVLNAMKGEEVAASLAVSLDRWLDANAREIGEVLKTGHPDATGYALGAILSGPPWDQTAIKNWDLLVLPWLHAHSTKEVARHLLYKSLRTVEAYDETLLSSAVTWLERYGHVFSAQFVLSGLLLRDDLSIEDSHRVAAFAASWLSTYHNAGEARFVLSRLLKRENVPPEIMSEARRFTFSWLREHHHQLDSKYVLSALLDFPDLSDDERAQGRQFAHLWLERHLSTLDARFVLEPLLRHDDVQSEGFKSLLETTLKWLDQNHLEVEAQSVLTSLLESDLSAKDADRVRAIALGWLETHEGTVEIQYVLKVALNRADLEDDDAKRVRELALRWLESNYSTHDAQFIFYALLGRSDLATGEVAEARELALRWLELHHDTLEAGFVLPPLLDQREFQGDEAAPLLEWAVKWLENFYDTTDAEFVLKRLFRRSDVPDSASVPLLTSAIQRLRERLADDEATFLLRSCLQYRIEHDTLSKELVALAIRWLELHPGNPNGDYVWNRVLRYRSVSDGDWLKVSGFALVWLKGRKVTDRDFDRTTNSLLMRVHLLDPADRTLVIQSAVELLGTRLDEQGRRRMVVSLGWQAQSLPDDDPLKQQINEALSAG